MNRRSSRNAGPTIALVVVGVLVALAIAVVFDVPTSVYLLAALAVVVASVSTSSSRRGNR